MQVLDDHEFTTVGRLKPGATQAQALAELLVITRGLHNQHLDNPFVSSDANIRPLLESIVGDLKTPLYILFAATSCVLLIACLNLADLLVARGPPDEKSWPFALRWEAAVRLASPEPDREPAADQRRGRDRIAAGRGRHSVVC